FSWKPRCTADSAPPLPSDSTVSTRLPPTVAASVRQESVGLSSTSTVQAPHSPPSQPVLVPVRPTFSRRQSSSRILSATASERSRPFSLHDSSRAKCFFPCSSLLLARLCVPFHCSYSRNGTDSICVAGGPEALPQANSREWMER